MPSNKSNLYVLPSDHNNRRVMQDLVDRVNFLTGELDRVRGLANSASPGVDAAKRESPGTGILEIPSPSGSGFIRVNEDGVIKDYAAPAHNPELIGICIYTNVSNGTIITNTTTETSIIAAAASSVGSTRVMTP